MNRIVIISLIAVFLFSATCTPFQEIGDEFEGKVEYANDLIDYSDKISNKTDDYTGDMETAMDCALEGRPLHECSPELMEEDFDDETEDFKMVLGNA